MADQAPPDNAPQPAWDAAQYEAALAHLERLQDMIDNMRTTVPSIVAPIQKRNTDKAQLFVDIKSAAQQAVDDVQTLRTTWTSEQTQNILKQSRESSQKDDDFSKADNVARYGWT